MYITWKTLNWKGKVSALLNYIFFKIGLKNSGLNIFFKAIKN
jgi:hypothetical protein